MAKKTTAQIERAIYDALESFFVGKINGMLYPSDCRPKNSELEDAVINVGRTSSEQIQEGSVNINIYVKDIDNNSGRLVPDKDRIEELSLLSGEIVDILNMSDTDYSYREAQSPESVPVPGINQRIVNISLKFKCITF